MMKEQIYVQTIPYLPLTRLSEALDIPLPSLKAKLHVASKKGIPLPERRRIGKTYFYNAKAFCEWLWQHSDDYRRDAPTFQ